MRPSPFSLLPALPWRPRPLPCYNTTCRNAGEKPSMDYYYIFRGIEDAGVDYLVVGGLAVNLHGIPRMTCDVDVMIDLGQENMGYEPSVAVEPRDFADPAVRER